MSFTRYADPGAAFAGSRSMRNRKLGDARMRSEPALNTGLESLFRLSGLVEVEQGLEIPVGDRPAIGAARQSREDCSGASFIRIRQRSGGT